MSQSSETDTSIVAGSSHVTPLEEYLSAAAGHMPQAGGSFNPSQIKVIHIIALSGACISLVLVLITLRWFLLMRRSFRHRLVMYLIISDTLKAICYFVFPVVTFARGPVDSDSNLCQASGFLLVFSTEASDMAIFMIALHSILYILRPNNGMGEGGLFPYRKWIYLIWLGPALLAASLAFVATSRPYVTAGTFCYLPKRPTWYRLALSWVPRYLIICMILVMYIWIYIYIHVKFRGFDNLADTDSSYGTQGQTGCKSHPSNDSQDLAEQAYGRFSDSRPGFSSVSSSSGPTKGTPPIMPVDSRQMEPWDSMTFVTTKRTPGSTFPAAGQDEDPQFTARYGSAWSGETQLPSGPGSIQTPKPDSSRCTSRKASDVPVTKAKDLEEAKDASQELVGSVPVVQSGGNDQLKQTRAAIRKQLRYLFIYPLVYIIMWSFPFASQALSYDTYYVMHPVYWLSVVQTVMLTCQAGIDSLLFSWTERPWRKIDKNSRLSIPFLHRQSRAFLQKRCPEKCSQPEPQTSVIERPPPVKRHANWWEAEGRRRNDSVWMGTSTYTDTISPVLSRVRTRSKSPEKPNSRGTLHTRTRSSEKPLNFVPKLEDVPIEAPASSMQSMSGSQRRATITPMKGLRPSKRHRRSLSAGLVPPETVPESEGDSST